MQKYLAQHALYSALKQSLFKQRYGQMEWNVVISQGLLTFARKYNMEIEVLGSYSAEYQTWLWSWANTGSNFPPEAINIATKLKSWGETKGIEPFIRPQLNVDENNQPELLSMLAIGLAKLPAFYKANTGSGFITLLVKTENTYSIPKMTNVEFINFITDVISQIPIAPHKTAVIGFVSKLGWSGKDDGDRIVVKNPSEKSQISVDFDAMGRITNFSTTISK